MDPIPLSAVRAAVSDATPDTAVNVAAPVRTVAAGAKTYIADDAAAADVRDALAGAAADTAVVVAYIVAATVVVAAADSGGDLYRRACRNHRDRRHCGLHGPRSTCSGRRVRL